MIAAAHDLLEALDHFQRLAQQVALARRQVIESNDGLLLLAAGGWRAAVHEEPVVADLEALALDPASAEAFTARAEALSAVVAHDLMAPVTTTLGIADRLHRAAEDFARSDFERLPVLAEDGTFRGVVTKRDLLAVYAQEVLGRPAVLSTFVASDQPGQAGTAVELPPDFSLRSIAVSEELAGRTLAECALPQRFAVRVIEIRRPGPAGPEWIVPDATTVVGYGDELVVLGPTKRVDALSAGRFDEPPATGVGS